MDPASLFKALSDLTRIRCLALLVTHEELCVCELTHALALPQPKVSHHLAALRKVGLVTDRKEGLWIYYQLNRGLPRWVVEVITTATEGVSHDEPFCSDGIALEEMPNRPAGICSA